MVRALIAGLIVATLGREEMHPIAYLNHKTAPGLDAAWLRTPCPVKLCNKSVRLLAIVEGERLAVSQRRALRHLQGQLKDNSTQLMFVMGRNHNTEFDRVMVDRIVYDESLKHKDILQANYAEKRRGYHDLRAALDWVHHSCPDVHYFFLHNIYSLPNWKLLRAEAKEMARYWNAQMPVAISRTMTSTLTGGQQIEHPSASGFMFNRATFKELRHIMHESGKRFEKLNTAQLVVGAVLRQANIPIFNDHRILGAASPGEARKSVKGVLATLKKQKTFRKEQLRLLVFCGLSNDTDAATAICPCESWLSYLSPFSLGGPWKRSKIATSMNSDYTKAYNNAVRCTQIPWRSDSLSWNRVVPKPLTAEAQPSRKDKFANH
eukprot:Gregarina_sp_Poly_1__196@NODE_1045_length_5261_cov_14_130920_g725_i0_p2_GENE_NODE_1045_length_5261_cov_14_130920_g725_i0NODE_1045_length_5261_cov_14_130920_g725_i0_p2_ORF_typecomplete_len377_score32_57Galactosyl_T/PF01762_21/1_5e08_NODE_1045_length_5261_cov_14_130920_g725_i031254255